MQGLSQIRENFPANHTPKNLPTGARRGGDGGGRGGRSSASRGFDDEEEDLGRHPYSSKETMALFNASTSRTISSSGINKPASVFGKKVTNVYNNEKPKGTRRHNLKMFCSHFDQTDRDVKKFCGIYKNEAANYQSGATGADILRAALRVFNSTPKKNSNMSMFGSRSKTLKGGLMVSSPARARARNARSTLRVANTRLVMMGMTTPHKRLNPNIRCRGLLRCKGTSRRRRLEGGGGAEANQARRAPKGRRPP